MSPLVSGSNPVLGTTTGPATFSLSLHEQLWTLYFADIFESCLHQFTSVFSSIVARVYTEKCRSVQASCSSVPFFTQSLMNLLFHKA
jgi:hypothetical protein